MLKLYTDTPLAMAIFELLSDFQDNLVPALEEAEIDIKSAGALKVYIFGGCGVHIHTNARGSNDLDVNFDGDNKVKIENIQIEVEPIYYFDQEGGDSILELDPTFTPDITPVLNPDFKDNAIPLLVKEDNLLHIYLVSALDIAISKLGRFQKGDQEDLISLYKLGRFTFEEFKNSAAEALLYTPTEASLRSNIDQAIMILEELDKK